MTRKRFYAVDLVIFYNISLYYFIIVIFSIFYKYRGPYKHHFLTKSLRSGDYRAPIDFSQSRLYIGVFFKVAKMCAEYDRIKER